jgi:lysozyme
MIDLIDISRWNDINDWNLVKNSVSGILIKTSQNTWEDFTFKDKYYNARSVNLPIGLWHFYQPDVSPQGQITAYLNIYNYLPAKHRPMLDCEEISYYNPDGSKVLIEPPSKVKYTQWIKQWLESIETATGIIPMVYTRKSFWDQWVDGSDWSHYPLWVANYGVTKPILPNAWKEWVFWQTGQFNCPGIPNPVDHDFYDGTPEEVRLFLDGVSGSSVIPPVSENYLNARVISVNGVNVRTGHGTNYPIVRTEVFGAELKIVDVYAPTTDWGQFLDGNWVALKYQGTEIVKIQ